MFRKMFFIAAALFSVQGKAQSDDPLNMYRWNRTNALLGNGQTDTSPWFEWWYYKVVLPDTGESFFTVYGVVNPWDTQTTQNATRSYVTFGDFANRTTNEQNFSVEQFSASYDKVQVQIEDNIATDNRVIGKIINQKGEPSEWNFSVQHRWTFNPLGGNLTGKNLTNIEWYTAQADARCSGYFISAGRRRDFLDAPCYQDRNWGKSFPKWWTWIVSNNFKENPDSALAIGGGNPTILNAVTSIESVTIGLKHKGIEYSWRPHNFDKVTPDVSFGRWNVTAENISNRIEVSAWAPPSEFIDLQFVDPANRVFHDYETLTGKITVKLFERTYSPFVPWRLVDTLTSDMTGIEYGSYETQNFLDSH